MGLYSCTLCNGDGPRENDVRPAPGVPCSAGPAAVGPREEQQLAHVGRDAARRSDEDVPPPLPVRPSVRAGLQISDSVGPFLASTRCFFP